MTRTELRGVFSRDKTIDSPILNRLGAQVGRTAAARAALRRVRWSMPDDAGPEGLTIVNSYWDRTPYVEEDDDGTPRYVEHHRTLGDWVDLLWASGFAVTALHEPQWPEGLERVWGGWGPLRGRLIPGTAIIVARLLAP